MFQPAACQWPPILRNNIGKVNTDIDMCTLSPQEAAFGIVVRLFDFLSKPNFPLQWASAVKVRKDWGATAKRRNTTKRQKQVGGSEMGEEKKERKSQAKQVRYFAATPSLHQTLQHSSSPPSPFSPWLLANKHVLLHTHGVHSKTAISHERSQAPSAYTHTNTRTHEESRRAVLPFTTLTHVLHPSWCLSWLYITP